MIAGARKCRYCDAVIFWARNVKTGKLVPLEVDSDKSTTRFVLIDDPLRRDDVERRCEAHTVRGYRTHFETCPGADEARRRDQ